MSKKLILLIELLVIILLIGQVSNKNIEAKNIYSVNVYKVNKSVLNSSKEVNDPLYSSQWYIKSSKCNLAWNKIKQKREIKVAVLDTGVDYTHLDLKNRVIYSAGYNFVNNNKNVMDYNGHGTHIAGVIAAEANNKIGICGVVGKLDVKIIPIKVLDDHGDGDSVIIAKAIKYAADKGVDIINLSLGGDGKDKSLQNAISYARNKKIFVVTASGNENRSCDNDSPASDLGAYTVAAIGDDGKRADFSDYGNCVKISAPGTFILSTIPKNKYEEWEGTSESCPIVAGIAAMLKAQKPEISPSQIENILNSSSDDISPKGKDKYTGYGEVNAYRAISLLSK